MNWITQRILCEIDQATETGPRRSITVIRNDQSEGEETIKLLTNLSIFQRCKFSTRFCSIVFLEYSFKFSFILDSKAAGWFAILESAAINSIHLIQLEKYSKNLIFLVVYIFLVHKTVF